MALGARGFDILRLVVRDGLRLTLIGLAIGLLVSLGFAAILTKVLYGLTPGDAGLRRGNRSCSQA